MHPPVAPHNLHHHNHHASSDSDELKGGCKGEAGAHLLQGMAAAAAANIGDFLHYNPHKTLESGSSQLDVSQDMDLNGSRGGHSSE
uniref:Uncharacterized protein n=1 Tax=Ditylenchus dipsaci TaxID=166011 RepID=A0A915D258_9BILA